MTTKEKWALLYGIVSTIVFFVFLVTDYEGFALLAIFYAITSSEYKIRDEIEKGRK